MTKEKLLCLLTSPSKEGQPFGVSVYAVDGETSRCILKAVSPPGEILGFLSLVQDGLCVSKEGAEEPATCI